MKYFVLMLTWILFLQNIQMTPIGRIIHNKVWGLNSSDVGTHTMWPFSPFGFFYLSGGNPGKLVNVNPQLKS